MKRHLFCKIFATYLVIIALSFFILNLFVREEIKKVMTAQIEGQLMTYAQLVDLNSSETISHQLRQIARISGARVTLVDVKGTVFADSEKEVVAGLENHLDRAEVQEARLKGKGSAIRFSRTIGVDMLYVAVPAKRNSEMTGYVRLARPFYDVRNTIEKVYDSFFLALFIVAVCSLFIAIIFSYRLAAPIQALERFTERLRQGPAGGAVLLDTTDETKKLADNINYLVEELNSQIRLANEENSKLVTAFTSMTEGVIILDGSDRIEVVNQAMSNILAIQYGDIVGKTLMETFRNVDLQKAFLKYKEKRELVSQEITIGNVQPVILSVSISGVKGNTDSGKTMVVFHDVTRLKKLERVRVDFVANVTHEIRTPLTAILGYLETIREGAIGNPEDARKFIDIVISHAQRLNRLVEDLLIISRIELGEMNFHFEDILLNDALTGVIPVVEPKARLKNIVLDNLITAKSTSIRVDKDRFSQIMINTFDNAVKFTPVNGKVSISAEETKGYIVVKVVDTGIGVPQEEIERLGERFFRVDRNRSRELGGTGLGLSIVKHLMAAHGGKMVITSNWGRGTEVSLFFPWGKKEL